jgi:osmoprotectant transport system ATP-binding protein
MAVRGDSVCGETLNAAVEFDRVQYRVDGREILNQLAFEIHDGETVVLLGRSGSGKTTALRMVNRLLLPTSGEVRVAGKPTSGWDPIALRRKIGYVIQEIGLFPHFTVRQNIGLVPKLNGESEATIDGRCRELLAALDLDPASFMDRYPHQLSGGQRQRVGIARALAADPPVLLFDEPFGKLDPITRAEVQKQFAALTKRLRKSTLFVTHDVREALLLGSRIGLMQDGRLLLLDKPEAFLGSQLPEAQAFRECLA